MDFAKIIEDGWSVVIIYPKLFMAVSALSLIGGWTAAWIVLNNRLTFYKELLDQYERVIADKIPGQLLGKPKRFDNSSRWVLGVIAIIATSFVGYYIISSLQDLPRHLTGEQREILNRQARATANTFGVMITIEQGCRDCAQYAADLETALRGAGWQTSNGVVLGPPQRPRLGLGIIPGLPSEGVSVLEHGLRAAGIDFEIMPPPPFPRPPPFNQTELLVTVRTSR